MFDPECVNFTLTCLHNIDFGRHAEKKKLNVIFYADDVRIFFKKKNQHIFCSLSVFLHLFMLICTPEKPETKG